jgi:nitric oxide reductase subunit C
MRVPLPGLVLAVVLLAACSSAPVVQPTPTLDAVQQQGQAVFTTHCAQCHSLVPDTVVIGPSLAGIATRASGRVEGSDARLYIETSILFPKKYHLEGFPDTMPTNFSRLLTLEELDALMEYLITLK